MIVYAKEKEFINYNNATDWLLRKIRENSTARGHNAQKIIEKKLTSVVKQVSGSTQKIRAKRNGLTRKECNKLISNGCMKFSLSDSGE